VTLPVTARAAAGRREKELRSLKKSSKRQAAGSKREQSLFLSCVFSLLVYNNHAQLITPRQSMMTVRPEYIVFATGAIAANCNIAFIHTGLRKSQSSQMLQIRM
jgi:hypothetical protein